MLSKKERLQRFEEWNASKFPEFESLKLYNLMHEFCVEFLNTEKVKKNSKRIQS